jgi:hypothetical protein
MPPGSFVAYLHAYSMPSWQSISSTECSAVLSSSPMHPMHLLDAHLAELPRILSDSVSFELPAEFLPQMHRNAYAQCPLGRALQNPQQNSVCNCVLLTQPYLQSIQQP